MNKPINIKAIIFDRDGVIINTEGLVIESVKFAFKQLGFNLEQNDIENIIGRSSDVYKEYFLNKWDFNYDKYLKIQREYFYKHLNTVSYFNDTVTYIKKLFDNNIDIALTTSASKKGTDIILKRIGIEKMFKVIVTKEDCKYLKPNPEPYLLASKKLNVEPKYCLAIEDTSLGIEAAVNAGMISFAIPNEYTHNQDFSKADYILKSISEIDKLVVFIK